MNGRPGAMRGALLAATLLLLTGCGSTMLKDASVTVESWGEVDGAPVALYTLDNGRIRASITNFGATVTELLVPDRAGDLGDIVLGFDSLEGYRTRSPYFGCTVGRVGNRIANGAFSIDGERFQLLVNNGPHQLHGGPAGLRQGGGAGGPADDGGGAAGATHPPLPGRRSGLSRGGPSRGDLHPDRG
ncbi:MAG: hypothetical protein ACO4CW_00080 [Planctomycetota bacterium]